MNKIVLETTPEILAAEIRLMKAAGKDTFVLIEGDADSRLLKKFTRPQCELTVCHGRENLLATITILDAENGVKLVGIADRDYADLTSYPEYNGEVIFTDENDVEIMLIKSPALESVIREFGDEGRAQALIEAQSKELSDLVFDWAAPVGALRLISIRDGLALKFAKMRYQFDEPNSSQICINQTSAHVVNRTETVKNSEKSSIQQRAEEVIASTENQSLLCQGHDCLRVIGRALRRSFGSNSEFDSRTKFEGIGRLLRLAYEYEHFQKTEMYSGLRDWEARTGGSVLR